MLRVTGRAAIAAGHDLAAGRDAADHRADGVGDGRASDPAACVLEVGAVEELLLDALFKHGGIIRRWAFP